MSNSTNNLLILGDAHVDLTQRSVHWPDRRLDLTVLEADLLRYLAERRGRWVDRETLLTEVWGYSRMVVTRAADHAVSRLRRKIEPDPGRPRWLTSTRGGGYRLEHLDTPTQACPLEVSSFVGRVRELAWLGRALRRGRITGIVGPVGIGKRRLACRAAHGWDGEVTRVSLEGARGAQAQRAVAAGLGARGSELEEVGTTRDRILVLLTEASCLTTRDLAWLRRLRRCAVLVVGAPEQLTGRRTLRLGPLGDVDAAMLVRERSPVELTHAEAAALAAAFGGHPLAIELAARAVGGWALAASGAVVGGVEHVELRHQS
ncbi:MAG: response regulator transcription factor [Myxococcales bacterium]|nr:response regulator transcription factor [Myxococcales bacterium]